MSGAPIDSTFDLVLAGGTIIDGTGADRYTGDLGIRGDGISEIGDLSGRSATRRIDVFGHIVAPGFIDALHNADMAVVLSPDTDMASAQGITTGLVGCCGVSMAPVSAEHREEVRHHAFFKTGYHDLGWDWLSVDDYLEAVDGVSALNVATLMGFDNLWFATRGFDASSPSSRELANMRALAAEGMEQGAIGMSHGAGAASLWSTHQDVVEVAKGLADSGGVYACHQRYGLPGLGWVHEGIGVGAEAGIPVHFLHFKSNSDKTHGREREMLEIVDEARERGTQVTLGSYPYSSGGGGVRVPAWAEEGGHTETLARLQDPPTRRRIVAELDDTFTSWDAVHLTAIRSEANRWLEGGDLYELARGAGTTPGEILCRLVECDYGAQHVHVHAGGESGLPTIMQHENHIACSDAIYAGAKPHPRCYGAYARYLGVYVRERQVLTLEECIRQMTSSPASMIGLHDRGRLQKGAKADVVVFDAETVVDRASANGVPAAPPGIEYVVVNGVVIRENDAFTGATPGRALRRGRQ